MLGPSFGPDFWEHLRVPQRLSPSLGAPASPGVRTQGACTATAAEHSGDLWSRMAALRRTRLDRDFNFPPFVTTGLLLPSWSHSLLSDKCSGIDVSVTLAVANVKLVASRRKANICGWRGRLPHRNCQRRDSPRKCPGKVSPPALAGPRAGGKRGHSC